MSIPNNMLKVRITEFRRNIADFSPTVLLTMSCIVNNITHLSVILLQNYSFLGRKSKNSPVFSFVSRIFSLFLHHGFEEFERISIRNTQEDIDFILRRIQFYI